jgi:hypothetical protein
VIFSWMQLYVADTRPANLRWTDMLVKERELAQQQQIHNMQQQIHHQLHQQQLNFSSAHCGRLAVRLRPATPH